MVRYCITWEGFIFSHEFYCIGVALCSFINFMHLVDSSSMDQFFPRSESQNNIKKMIFKYLWSDLLCSRERHYSFFNLSTKQKSFIPWNNSGTSLCILYKAFTSFLQWGTKNWTCYSHLVAKLMFYKCWSWFPHTDTPCLYL